MVSQIKQKGFTIVELLIVIVVIAILAAISIVAYTGIQNNARASERQSDASNIARVAEVYFSNESVYPTTQGHFANAGNASLPNGVVVNPVTTGGAATSTTGPSTPENANTPKTYTVRVCEGGGIVHYWDPRNGEGAKTLQYGGGCS